MSIFEDMEEIKELFGKSEQLNHRPFPYFFEDIAKELQGKTIKEVRVLDPDLDTCNGFVIEADDGICYEFDAHEQEGNTWIEVTVMEGLK